MDELVLHEDPRSGNCYKIALTAALLGIPLEFKRYDILRAETRTPEFLRDVNANGRIPVLQIGDRFLPESNAACCYLADGSALIAFQIRRQDAAAGDAPLWRHAAWRGADGFVTPAPGYGAQEAAGARGAAGSASGGAAWAEAHRPRCRSASGTCG